jgi:type I restriction enzyme S subunit
MFGDPVTNPKGWEVKKLGEITYKVTDGTHKTPTYTESGIPFLSAKNIKPYGLDWTVTKFISASEHAQLIKRCNPEPGDILLSKSGSLGTPAIVNTTKDFSLFESAALIKLKKEFIHPLFLVHFMKSKPGQKLMLRSTKGVAIKHLHLTDLRELKVIIPSIEHQGRFTKIVESLEVTMSKMVNKQHSPDDMFNSLSQKAFAGEL